MTTVSPFSVHVDAHHLKWDEPLRQRLKDFMERNAWTFPQVSRDMQRFYGRKKEGDGRNSNVGMGQSTLRSYVDCKYPASQVSLERLENRIRGWLDHREQGGKTDEIDESVTSAKLLTYGLIEAKESSKFVIIIGPTGVGKSLMTRHFANTKTRGGLVIVEAYDGMTPRAFLAAICRALGDADSGSKDSLLIRVAGLLAEHPRPIAIDEANFLREESINHLVYIWNQVNTGIALIGTQELEQAIRSSRLQRIRSRMKISITLNGLDDGEIRKRLEESFEAKQVTARVVELARIGSCGGYRDLDTLIDTALDLLDKNPEKTLEEAFEKVYHRAVKPGQKRR